MSSGSEAGRRKTVSWEEGGGRMQVSYDTQFELGDDFYASTLSVRDPRMLHRNSQVSSSVELKVVNS